MEDIEEIIELNVGGQYMATTRAVLCSVEGSMLAGMFSGNFDDGNRKDKDGRLFLDVDPQIFGKILSHLRLRRLESPDHPTPLPFVPKDMLAEYAMWMRYLGLESFMYDGAATPSCNLLAKLAELSGVSQSSLVSSQIVRLSFEPPWEVSAAQQDKLLGINGLQDWSISLPNVSTMRMAFLTHCVHVEAMELGTRMHLRGHRAEWQFWHGSGTVQMAHDFAPTPTTAPSTSILSTGLKATNVVPDFVDEVIWRFYGAFPVPGWVLQKLVLHGRVLVRPSRAAT